MAKQSEILELLLKVAGGEDVEKLRAALAKLSKQGDASADELQGLVEQVGKLQEISDTAGEFSRLTAAVAKADIEIGQARAGLAELNTEFTRTDKSSREVAAAFKQADAALAKLEKTQAKQRNQLKETGDELEAAGVNIEKLVDETARLDAQTIKATRTLVQQATGLEATRRAAEKNAAAFKALSGALGKARADLNNIAAGFIKAGAAAAATAATLAAYGTARFFTSAIDDAREFQRVIAEVGAVAGASGDQLQKLEQAARDAAQASGFGFVETAQALGELARATGDVDTAIASLPATLSLAAAGGLEVSKAAEIVTTTLTQFGLAASESARIADILAQGANSTTASVEQLGNSLSYAAPLARQLGLDVEPTVAIIGALADQGFRGERAGTALRNVFSALADPASKFSKALSTAGITSRDFGTVIEKLSQQADGGRKVFLSLDAQARPAIIALARDGGAAIRGLVDDFGNAEGAAERVAKQMRDNLDGAARNASLSFDKLRQELVKPLLEPLKNELQSLGEALDAFATSPEFFQIRDALAGMFEAGVEGIRAFIKEVDFTEVAGRITAFANDAGSDLRQIGDSVTDIAGKFETFADVVSTTFGAIETGIFGIATAVGQLAALGLKLVEIQTSMIKSITLFDEFAEVLGVEFPDVAGKAGAAAGALQAITDEFAARTSASARATRDALNDIGEGYTKAGADARAGAGGITAATDQAAASVQISAGAIEGAVTDLGAAAGGLNDAVSAAAVAARELNDALTGGSADAISAARAKYAAANAEVAKLEQGLRKAANAAQSVSVQTTDAGDKGKQSFDQVTQAANDTGKAVQQVGEKTEEAAGKGGDSMAAFVTLLQQLNDRFAAVSENARQLFVETQKANVRLALSLDDAIKRTLEAGEATQKAIDNQQASIEGVSATFQQYADAAVEAGDAIAGSLNASSAQLDVFAEAVRAGNSSFDLLSKKDLDALGASIDRAADRMRSLEAAAAAANARMLDLNRQLQDERDRALGDEEAIAERAYQERLQQIEEIAQATGDANSVIAQENRRLAEENHQRELARIRERKNAESGGSGSSSRDTSSGSSAPRPGTSGGGRSGSGALTFAVTVNGSVIGSDPARLAEELARLVNPELKKIARRSA